MDISKLMYRDGLLRGENILVTGHSCDVCDPDAVGAMVDAIWEDSGVLTDRSISERPSFRPFPA